MGRRAKPPKENEEAKRAPARTSPKSEIAKVRDLEKRLAEAFNREKEALEQQTATSEILKAISGSPTDLQTVFDRIAASATRLCDALYGLVFRFDGEMITLVAHDPSS